MSKYIFSGLLLILAGLAVSGKEVPADVAGKVGINFYHEKINRFTPTAYADVRIRETIVRHVSGMTAYYIFNMEPAGYIIVSADDAAMPVPAYSFEGAYSLDNAPSQCVAWMKQVEDQVLDARLKSLPQLPSVARAWAAYGSSYDPANRSRAALKAVAPLIISNWDQGVPYNEQCPADPAGPGGHAIVGCVPVCMGQLMYYYRWPVTGTGSYSYYDSTYGTISADFGATTYEWGNMTNTAKSSTPGIAKLLFHLGVSCDLVYGPGSSGMYNHKAAYALRTFFKYSPQTQYLFRDSTILNWDSVLIAHLDRAMPMYYAGWSVPNINGHAFVCDGYQDTAFFHFNFGWSGQNNGYFYTNNLTPGGNIFTLAQEVIINAYPDTVHYTYPSYCQGTSRLTYLNGSLGDGSGPLKDYQPSSTCSWLIDPQPAGDSVSSITLTFNNFNTSSGDPVVVYDGGTAGDPVLGTFSGDTLPAAITGSRNKMLVTFNSGSGSTAPGWFANYKATIPVWCTGTTAIKADTAVITDGSFGFGYHNNSICRWSLQTKSGDPLTIYFRQFDTEKDKDILGFYDLGNNKKLGEISGHYDEGNLPDSITSPSGKMMVVFASNSSVTGDGWEIYYPANHTGIGESGPIRNLDVFPNPAAENIRVKYLLSEPGKTEIRLLDMNGNPVLTSLSAGKSGENEQVFDVSAFRPGIYLLQVMNQKSLRTRKVVIL